MTLNLKMSECERNVKDFFKCYESSVKRASLLRDEWHSVNEKQYIESETCPTCGQPLPAEQIEKAKANFNTTRATKLEEITAQGKREKADADLWLSKRDEWAKKLETLQANKKDCENEIERLNGLISDKTNNFADKVKVELTEINSLIAETEKNAQNGTENVQSKIYPIQEQITAEKAKIAEIDKVIAERELVERQKKRIADLEADEKRLATEYANLDKIAFLIDKFTKYKVDLLSEEINGHFQYAKFKLFEEQINGGIAEWCEVTYTGVSYSDLNNASRINTGLDIVNTLCKLNDKYAPVIIDNSESVINILPTTSQMICLVVSADDDMLRVEKGV